MGERPSGTVTFLFTDIEGSTRLWEADPDGMHRIVIEGYGYRWYRVGGLGHILKRKKY